MPDEPPGSSAIAQQASPSWAYHSSLEMPAKPLTESPVLDSTAEVVPILIDEARSLVAAYTAGSLSLYRLAWRLESAVNALGDAGCLGDPLRADVPAELAEQRFGGGDQRRTPFVGGQGSSSGHGFRVMSESSLIKGFSQLVIAGRWGEP